MLSSEQPEIDDRAKTQIELTDPPALPAPRRKDRTSVGARTRIGGDRTGGFLECLRYGVALAASISRYYPDMARTIAQPAIATLSAPLSAERNRCLAPYAALSALALADPRAAAALVEAIPDLKDDGQGQSRDTARLIVAKTLSARESEFWPMICRSRSDLEIVERED